MKNAGLASLKKVMMFTLIMASLVLAATSIGMLFRFIGFHETNIVIVYILSVLLTARFTQGYIYGILSSVIATLTFNFAFTKPYYSLSVNDPSYLVTFVVMTVTAIITSALTSKEKQSALDALEKEAETSALYHLTNQLTDAGDPEDIASITSGAIGDVLRCDAKVLWFDDTKKTERQNWRRGDGSTLVWSKSESEPSESTASATGAGGWFFEYPIQGRETNLGVVRLPSGINLSESQARILHSMIESTALAMDRFRSAQARIRSTEEAEKERYRGNLLRAISHDLRTPLSGIMGTAEMLKDMTNAGDPRRVLAEDIFRESDWLHSMVENILSLTRLRDGALPLAKQMEPVEEVVGGAVNRITRQTGRDIAVEAMDDVLFIPIDAGLIEQVLVNLLDNAVKHTLPGEEIKVSVWSDDANRQAVIRVADRGVGIREEDLPHIFQLFYTTPARQADASRGVGLGLTICEAIIKAHGGSIEAKNREDGPGALFQFTLPMEEQQNAKPQ